nr:E3 ubiquitin-protein ligase UPL1-like [Tanacetum cinerariifolium]
MPEPSVRNKYMDRAVTLYVISHRQTVIDRGVGKIGRRASSALLESLEVEGDPLLDPDASKPLMLTTEFSTSTGNISSDYYKNLKWLLEVSMFNDVIDTRTWSYGLLWPPADYNKMVN